MPSRNPYDRRSAERERRQREGMVAGWADGGIFPYGGPRRSTVEFEDLEAMVGQAAARGRRQAAEQAPERDRQARREAWAEGHAIGMDDGRMELRGWFEERFDDEIIFALRAARDDLSSLEENERSVTKAQLAERVDRLARLLAQVLADVSGGEA